MIKKYKLLLVAAGLVLVGSGFIKYDLPEITPTKFQPELTYLVSTYLAYYHYEGHPIDDTISKRLLDGYLEDLDYNKLYFLASDIEEFKKFETRLDDDLLRRTPIIDKPFLIYDRYRERVQERVTHALDLINQEFDFTKDESVDLKRHEGGWAGSKAELVEIWRKRIKDLMLTNQLKDKPTNDYVSILKKRYERQLKNINDFEAADILELFLANLAKSLDPHSLYLKPATKDNFDIEMGHSLEGIGATLRTEAEYTIIVSLVPGGPADKSKQLKPNDKIIAVAQGDGEPNDVIDQRIDKVVKQIRGPKGSEVRLTVIPADAADDTETKIVTLVRDRVELTDQDAKGEIHQLEQPGGKTMKVGVLELPSFYLDTRAKYRGDEDYKSTTRDVREILENFKRENVDGVVMDLRGNGGGSLDEAIQLTGLFIDEGPVVQIRNKDGRVRVEYDRDPVQVYDGPLVVLTSVFSASASEIFAGAIQDYGRGMVVGSEATHGKGTVQNVVGLSDDLARIIQRTPPEDVGGALKLTTHKFYRISGGSTQHKGVEADIVLPSPYDELDATEGSLDYALPWDEIESVKFKPYNQTLENMDKIRAESTARISKDAEFQYLKEDLERMIQNRERKTRSLNLAVRKKETTELDELRKARDIARLKAQGVEEPKPDQTPDDRDYILDETLQIMRDYITMRNEWVANLTAPKNK